MIRSICWDYSRISKKSGTKLLGIYRDSKKACSYYTGITEIKYQDSILIANKKWSGLWRDSIKIFDCSRDSKNNTMDSKSCYGSLYLFFHVSNQNLFAKNWSV